MPSMDATTSIQELEDEEDHLTTQHTFKQRHKSIQLDRLQKLNAFEPPIQNAYIGYGAAMPTDGLPLPAKGARFRDYLADIGYPTSRVAGQPTNFMTFNASSVLDYKHSKMVSCQQKIDEIHAKLMEKKRTSQDVCDFGAIQRSIHPKHREQFLKNKDHEMQLAAMNGLNLHFQEVTSIVSSYRVELGVCLQNLMESYNSIYVQQFETFYTTKLKKEQQYQEKIEECQRTIEKWKEMQGELQ